MKKRILALFTLLCLLLAGSLPAYAELSISSGSQGLSLYTEDGISYLRLETDQQAVGDQNMVSERVNTAETFYVDLKLRIPEESTAELSVFLQFQNVTTDSGQKDWVMVVQARNGSWSVNNNGNGSMANQTVDGIIPSSWYTMRIIFEKSADGYYDVIWTRLVSGIYQELARFDLLDGTVTAINSNVYLKQQAMNNDFGEGVKAVCDIAQFAVKVGDPNADNSQIEQAAGSMELFGDIDSERVRENYSLLYDLGMLQVYDDGTVREDEYLTRGDEALALAVLGGLDTEAYQNVSSPYQDIANTDPKKAACLAVSAAGILTTNNAGMFGVDDPVSYEELVLHLLDVLGYKDMMDAIGADENDYYTEAGRIDLLQGITIPSERTAPVTRGDAAAMFLNAINIAPVKLVAAGNRTEYRVMQDTDVLAENADIYQQKGVLDGNDKTGLVVYDSGLRENEVSIGGESYAAGSSGAEDFLGQAVRVYYRLDTETGRKTILHIQADSRVKKETFVSRDITKISSTAITVQGEKRAESYAYDASTKIIYNNKPAGSSSLSQLIGDLEAFSGTVTWICNDAGAADAILIQQYRNIMLEGYNETERMLYNQYGADLSLPEDDESVFVQKANGNTAELTDLNRGDLLSVMISRPNAEGHFIVTIIQNADSVSGVEVERLEGTGREQRITLNGTQYYVAPELQAAARPAMSPSGDDTDEMRQEASRWTYSAGTSADFLLDVMGNVAGIRNRIVTEIGFVVKAAEIKERFEESNMLFKIFTSEGEMFESPMRSTRVTVDGVRYKGTAQATQYLKGINVATTVVRFQRTAEGLISLLDTYQTQAGGTDDCLARIIDGRQDWMRQSLNVMGNKVAITGSYNFLVPHVGSDLYDDDSMFQTRKLEDYMLYDAYSSTGTGVVRDNGTVISGIGAADIVVQYYSNSDAKWDTMLITDVAVGLDSNGEEATYITAYVNGGGEQRYQIGKDAGYNNKLSPLLEKGAVINPAYNAKGEIIDNIGRIYNGSGSYALVNGRGEAITQAADGSGISSNLNSSDSTGESDFRNILGDIVQMLDQHLIIRLTNGTYEVVNISTAPVFVVDDEGVRAGTVGELTRGQRIFITMGSSQVKMLVLYV